MAKKDAPSGKKTQVEDYRHEDAKRKNNPPAKIAAEGVVPVIPKAKYEYNPHLPPVLRFDDKGGPDKLPYLLEEAAKRPLDKDELKVLSDALRKNEPWLEWAGKREQKSFEVDPVALHIHERISAQAILKVAQREDVEKSLFADPELEYHEAIKFYRHDIDWTNRLILGDSLQVMSSLAKREDLAGKVQMIYMDPPYGINYASNFQPRIGTRDVKDRDQDLTREAEMVRAYRDTWYLGVHSYLSYLRDRLIIARELLSDSGSIFVQIGDENVHLVRAILDEVFGRHNFFSEIIFRKTLPLGSSGIGGIYDILLWFAKNKDDMKYHQLYVDKNIGTESAYTRVEEQSGHRRPMTREERDDPNMVPKGAKTFAPDKLASSGYTPSCFFEFEFAGRTCPPNNKSWRTNIEGMQRLLKAERVIVPKDAPRYVLYHDDFSMQEVNNFWTDTLGATDMQYVVQTTTKVIERCVLMTTDPGELVLDPTCGGGTTAFVAEEWGRRWITVDTSRVAVAIARQRLLTADFAYYAFKNEAKGISSGFVYKSVPHLQLKDIAQNTNLDPIFTKHEPILDEKLVECNKTLGKVTRDLLQKLDTKLMLKQRHEGKKNITDADKRRWLLPDASKKQKFEHWTVPFDTDEEYPAEFKKAVEEYRKAWRAKMDEVNACIAANAESEELVDKPEVGKGVVRVSGPFTVEAVQPAEMSLGDIVDVGKPGFEGAPEEMGTFEKDPVYGMRYVETRTDQEAKNLDAYLDKMIRLLRIDGAGFLTNKQMNFSRLERLPAGASGIHAEGRWTPAGEKDSDPDGPSTVCVAFGPQYGPVTAKQVEDVVRSTSRRGYDDLVIAGFNFDGPAQTVIAEAQHPKLRIHMAGIRPDVNPGMEGLLKEQGGGQLFTVFGQPRTKVEGPDKDGMYKAIMEGVDIYNPVENTTIPTGADKVAAWFIDGDYDGRTFCITQAFFPDKSAWEGLSKSLGGMIDEEKFEALSGTESLPFPAGKNKCVAVKVIDPRGNEVMKIHKLGE